jgi:cobalt-precorrin-5B (C1)-methyltransferase
MTDRQDKHLRPGFTTGTAAAAAAKAALSLLLTGRAPKTVRVTLLTGAPIDIPVHGCSIHPPHSAVCSVIKDAGDDPDITHRAEIGARVVLKPDAAPHAIEISGGTGVGRVTKPGLEIAPGRPAINPGPLKMITREIAEVLTQCGESTAVTVEVFVPKGEELARRTLNARLGILGGISILGTTGIVKPLSHAAYVATIRSALSVARAAGLNLAVLTTGRRSERHAQGLWPRLPEEAFVQMGDYFRASLEMAASQGFEEIRLAVFFGKAVKMAQEIPHTHASKARLTLDRLSQWTREVTGDGVMADEVLRANTARHAFDLLTAAHGRVIARVGDRMTAAGRKFAGSRPSVRGVIFDYEGRVVFDSGDNR